MDINLPGISGLQALKVLAQDQAGFVPYVQTRADEPVGQFAALDRNRDWSAYFLWQHGRRIDEHVARCPATMAMLEGVPQVEVAWQSQAAFIAGTLSSFDAGFRSAGASWKTSST